MSQTEPGWDGLGDDMTGAVAKVRAIGWQSTSEQKTNQERDRVSDAGIGIWCPFLVCIQNQKGSGLLSEF